MYKHEEDMPHMPKMGKKPKNDASCGMFKSQASDQAYGQSGKSGFMADHKKIKSQHFSGAYSDDSSGHE